MIRRVLVANRGEIARRVFRTCRDSRIDTVAVYSDGDAGEPHVADADVAVRLEGRTAAETYLDQEAVIAAATAAGADAVHHGYGFLSDNAEFARAVVDAGLIWIGPSPEAIEAMGSKVRAKAIMHDAGVPCLPDADLTGMSDDEVLEAAETIGYPVLVKASAGGGGKGMRTVHEPGRLLEEVAGAKREAKSSFGDETVFLEKYLSGPRHIEIQVFGDGSGNVVSLHERECSIQRRHQKIIEESPSPVMTPPLRKRMGEAAVAAAMAVDYVGAGTVEFLVDGGEFYFLEMNTRLQVEHPVTEAVTGLDLVALQLQVAAGGDLPAEAMDPPISGHAIEARLYAEDPESGFLPATGPVWEFDFPETDGIRVDAGVAAGSTVSVYFDPMLAKVICHASTRREAAQGLASALRQARIHSGTTNRDLLVRILEHEEFLEGNTDTGFIDRIGLETLAAPLIPDSEVPMYALGAAVVDREIRVAGKALAGFRNVGIDRQNHTYRRGDESFEVAYENHPNQVVAAKPEGVEIVSVDPPTAVLRRGEEVVELEVASYGNTRFVDSLRGAVRLELQSRFPTTMSASDAGSLHAPMPGSIVRVEIEEGDSVEEGQTLIVLEAMKMEHTLRAPHGGVVRKLDCAVGDQVESNQVLVVIE